MKPDFMKSIRLISEDVLDLMLFCAEGKYEIIDTAATGDTAVLDSHGVTARVTLVLKRVHACRTEIRQLLNQLPVDFHAYYNEDGCSFVRMKTNRSGAEWGTTRHSDMLLMLGSAVGMCRITTPPELWTALPGGMPNILIETRIPI